jgi:uncharacterized membrane protein (UPF0182 family)
VQRYQLARYHVTDPDAFYQNNARWDVPADPEQRGKLQPPYRLFVQDPNTGQDQFALTSVYVPYKKSNLAAFVSVDSDATSPDYGKIQVLQLPNENTPGPGNIANNIQSDPAVTQALLPLNQGGSARVAPGNLLTLPVTGGLMFVQPLYASKQLSDASYPILRYVVVSYGDKVGIGDTLECAIIDVFGGTNCDATTIGGGGNPPPSGGGGNQGGGGHIPAKVRALLAEAQQDFDAADQAFKEGKVGAWATYIEEGRAKVDEAVKLLNKSKQQQSGSG